MEKIETLTDMVEVIREIKTPTSQKANMVVGNIRAQIKNYVQRNNLKSLVVGVSGGLDSAVVAALCQEEFTGVPLIGLSIPMSSTNAHKEQAEWVGNTFCTAFEEFNYWDETFQYNEEEGTDMMSEVFNTVSATDKVAEKAGFKTEDFPKNVLQGNIKARLRMITLYDLARKTNGMVLSTDNLSEFQMGFWTICGDVGDFGPIQNVGKGFELPAIARALGIRADIITQSPSDGLMVTEENTDEAQLGANYEEVDTIMSIYLGNINKPKEIIDKLKSNLFNIINDKKSAKKISNVITRYENSHFKRNGTINLTREQIGI